MRLSGLTPAQSRGTVVRTAGQLAGPYTVIVTAAGYAPVASTAFVTASGRVEVGTVVLARRCRCTGLRGRSTWTSGYLGTGPDPWGGVRAAFRATAELRREDFAMNYNQVVRAGISAIGATLRVELDVQAVRGAQLPEG
nr:hypothetical protein [Streptomyces sp. ISL-98]